MLERCMHTSGRAVRGRGACRGPAVCGAAPAGAAAGAAAAPHLPGSQACPLLRHGRCRQETPQILSCCSEGSSWGFRLAGSVLCPTVKPAHAGVKQTCRPKVLPSQICGASKTIGGERKLSSTSSMDNHAAKTTLSSVQFACCIEKPCLPSSRHFGSLHPACSRAMLMRKFQSSLKLQHQYVILSQAMSHPVTGHNITSYVTPRNMSPSPLPSGPYLWPMVQGRSTVHLMQASEPHAQRSLQAAKHR